MKNEIVMIPVAVSYQMSDEEIRMMGGTHECFLVKM